MNHPRNPPLGACRRLPSYCSRLHEECQLPRCDGGPAQGITQGAGFPYEKPWLLMDVRWKHPQFLVKFRASLSSTPCCDPCTDGEHFKRWTKSSLLGREQLHSSPSFPLWVKSAHYYPLVGWFVWIHAHTWQWTLEERLKLSPWLVCPRSAELRKSNRWIHGKRTCPNC